MCRAQQLHEELDWYGVCDAARVTKGVFLGTSNEDHVDDADYFAGISVVDRTPAVTRICSCVQLVDVVRPTRKLLNLLIAKTIG